VNGLAASLARFDRWAKDGLARTAARLLWVGSLPRAPERLLVYRIGNIGDVVTAVPALAALRGRFPRADIRLLTSPGSREAPGAHHVLSGSALVDELKVYYRDDIRSLRGIRGLARWGREFRPDLFIDLSHNLQGLRAALRVVAFAKAAGARAFLGGRVSTSPLFYRAQAKTARWPYDARRTLRLLAPLGIDVEAPLEFPLPRPAESIRRVDELLGDDPRPPICLAPGAKRPANRWPRERFAQVGRALAERRGARVFVLGGPAERELSRRVAGDIPGAAAVAGDFSVLDTVELLRRAHLLVTNDTGTLHLGAAAGAPTVAVFSARDLAYKWFPEGPGVRVLRAQPPCAGCRRPACAEPICMTGIEVAHALSACDELLDEPRDRAGREAAG